MVEVLEHLPPNVVGFKASGEITKSDYDEVVFPTIERYVRAGSPLNYLFIIDTSLKNFTAGAWVQDAWLGLKEIAKWRRVAIVSDIEAVRKVTDAIGHVLPGEYKGFALGEAEDAVQWAAASEAVT